MSTYSVSIGTQAYQVQITREAVLLNGEPVVCDLVSLNGNGLHQLSRGAQSVEVCLSTLPRGAYEVLIGGRRVLAQVDPAHRRKAGGATQINTGDIRAPMPGLIVDVLVQEGDSVAEGQVLVVQEAMKMQMQHKSPGAGRVEKVSVAVGDQVEKGAVLIKVSPVVA